MRRISLGLVLSAVVFLFCFETRSAVPVPLSAPDAFYSGENANDRAGYSLATGDIDCDGDDDILIGAPYYNGVSTYNGRIYIIEGPNPPSLDLTNAHVIIESDRYENFTGYSLATLGDVNGDGCDDFLIGAGYSSDAAYRAGAAYLFYGNSSLSGTISVDDADVKYVGGAASDYAGYAVAAAGDVNGDGYRDFLIGAPGDDNGARSDSGAVYLFYGSATLASMAVTAADTRFMGAVSGDQAGFDVAGDGDFNADGYDDILISAVGVDTIAFNAGAVYLIFGQAAAHRRIYDIGSGVPMTFHGERSGDQAGHSIDFAGDVDGDGDDDVLIGAPSYDVGTSISKLSCGAVYVVNGYARAVSATRSLASADTRFDGHRGLQKVGNAVSRGGDINGDGKDDIVVGAYTNSDFTASSGAFFVMYGGWPSSKVKTTANADTQLTGTRRYDYLGSAVAGGGDFNEDGLADILASATGEDTGGLGAGAVYMVHGL